MSLLKIKMGRTKFGQAYYISTESGHLQFFGTLHNQIIFLYTQHNCSDAARSRVCNVKWKAIFNPCALLSDIPSVWDLSFRDLQKAKGILRTGARRLT